MKYTIPKGRYKISGTINGEYFERDATPEENETLDKASGPCNEFLAEGRIINHESITEDGKTYFCSQCGTQLKVDE